MHGDAALKGAVRATWISEWSGHMSALRRSQAGEREGTVVTGTRLASPETCCELYLAESGKVWATFVLLYGRFTKEWAKPKAFPCWTQFWTVYWLVMWKWQNPKIRPSGISPFGSPWLHSVFMGSSEKKRQTQLGLYSRLWEERLLKPQRISFSSVLIGGWCWTP